MINHPMREEIPLYLYQYSVSESTHTRIGLSGICTSVLSDQKKVKIILFKATQHSFIFSTNKGHNHY